jgi:PAS domain S-box-containing protein
MEPSDAQLHVLIVEDERVVAKELQLTLRRLGYYVPLTVASGAAALQAVSERCPDLVIMDIRIEGEHDGIQTAELLKTRFDIPIVFLTAYADQATVARAKRTEPHAYLLKPVRLDELRSAVEIAIYKHSMERAQRARERWFATTLHSIGDAVISTDADGKVTLMNPVAEMMTGYRNAEVMGKPLGEILQLVEESTQEPIEDPVSRVLRDGKILHVHGVLRERGGGERVIADSAAPILSDTGKLLGVVIVFRDVSETRRMQRRLEFAERLTSLGTLAAGVAHEVNNPLSFVMSNIDFALTELRKVKRANGAEDSFAELEQALSEALVGAERVKQIVADLRSFARPTTTRPDRQNVNRVLQSAIDMTAPEVRTRATLFTELGEIPNVMGNETRLSQVFVNLLLNAAHACASPGAAGKEIYVRTRVDPNGRVVIEIEDRGCGMSPEIKARIFDPFFTTKEPGLGTGLGLAICHGIVTSFSGDITVDSREGVGTTFTVSLPAAPESLSQPPRSITSVPPTPGTSTRAQVLVIDDEPLLRTMIARMIGNEHHVTLVDSAEQALALIDDGKRYDVILSDLMMRGLSGMELHAALLQKHADQARRMIFLSGGAYTPDAAEFLQLMMRRHLPKPFTPDDLRSTLRMHLAKWGPSPRSATSN